MSASFPESPPTFIPRLPRILSCQRGAVVAFGRLLRHSRSHVLGDIENLFRIDRNMPFPGHVGLVSGVVKDVGPQSTLLGFFSELFLNRGRIPQKATRVEHGSARNAYSPTP